MVYNIPMSEWVFPMVAVLIFEGYSYTIGFFVIQASY